MTITIYTKPAGCFGCKKTKELFEAAGVPYVEVDITTNAAALEYICQDLGYSQAPVVICERDGRVNHWSGLNPPKISQVIEEERDDNDSTFVYDEDGDLDYEAYYHWTRLAGGRDFARRFGLTGISDCATAGVRGALPELENAAAVTAEVQNALVGLGKLIDRFNPEDWRTQDRIDEATADLRQQITTQ